MKKFPPLIRYTAASLLLLVTLLFALRIGFWLWFQTPSDPLSTSMLLQSLFVGLKFDIRLAALTLLPLLLLGWLPLLNPLRNRFGRWLWSGYLTLAGAVILLFYFVDFGHYSYLNIRLDSTVLRFADNPDISSQMVIESYPVVWITLGYLLLLTLLVWSAVRLMRHYAAIDYRPLHWPKRTLLISASLFAMLFAIYGKVSWYPLRWNDAFYSPNAFASAMALNPVLYFSDTYLNGGLPFDEEATRRLYPVMAKQLGVAPVDPERLNFTRPVTARPQLPGKPNVVIFLIESWASYKTSLSGNPLDPTPEYAKLAREGVYFPNFFVPHTGTAHSVFALITGSPDVQLGDTSSRNPTIVSQHLLLNSYQGYEKFYMLGGSASWRNIRALFANNIPDIQIFEEGSYTAPRNDVWGISDLNLLKEANQLFSRQQKPFVAVVQTSGNHRPYTIPADNDGFTYIEPPLDPTRYGFDDAGEFNAYRLSDFNIGRFFELARHENYFDNTLFVFLGDHGINGKTGEHTLKQEAQLLLGSYRVPFMLYAPKLLKGGQVIDKVGSELDIMTTVASITGQDHINSTFGRDLFDPAYDQSRYAFTINHSGVPLIGLIDKEYYFRMRHDGSEKNLFRLGSDEPRRNFLAEEPERATWMEAMTLGYYESARYVINHNRPQQVKTIQGVVVGGVANE